MSEQTNYTQTLSAAHATGGPRRFSMPADGVKGPDGYMHEMPFAAPDQLVDPAVLTRVMNGVANMCAFLAAKGEVVLRTAGPTKPPMRTLVDADGDTYRGFVLHLPEYYWREDEVSLKVLIDLPDFQTRNGSERFMGTVKTWAEPVSPAVALTQMLAWARTRQLHRNPDFPTYGCPLSQAEIDQLVGAANRIADTHQHYFAYSDGHCKSYEGAMHLTVDPQAYLGAPVTEGSMIASVGMSSYLYANHGRYEEMESVADLLEFACQIHDEEFTQDYVENWDEQD